jgi:uncharacterized protein YceK
MRVFGRIVQPLEDDDIPSLYHPTERTYRVIDDAAQGRYNNFPNGTSHSEGYTPIWSRIVFFSLALPFVAVGDTLLLPYDGYVSLKFRADPPYWYCIRKKNWTEFDKKIRNRNLPTEKDFIEAFSIQTSLDSPEMSFERFVALYELAPAVAPRRDYYFYSGFDLMPFRLFEYLLTHNPPIEDMQGILFSYTERDSLDSDDEKRLEALLKSGVNPNMVDPYDMATTVIDRLAEQSKTANPKTQQKIDRRVALFRQYGAKSFKELIQENRVSTPIPVSSAPELLDIKLRPLFQQLQQHWSDKNSVAFYLTYPECVPAGIPALIAVQRKTLKRVKIFERKPEGTWSEKPCRNWLVPREVWYLIITPKGVWLPELKSPLPTMVPAIRHITHDQYELWFCGNVIWPDDMNVLLTIFQLPKENFSSTYPENGRYQYAGNVGRGIFPAKETDAPFLDNYKTLSPKFALPGTWKPYIVNYGIPHTVAVFEHNTRYFGELRGVETDGFQMIVYPEILFKDAAFDLPCEKRKRGYWNEIGPANNHGLRISIFYGDNVSADTLQKLITLAQELR